MPNYAIVDVGSNSVRLVVYAVAGGGRDRYRREDLTTLANSKVMAGLAAYIKDGALTPAGIKKAGRSIAAHLSTAAYFEPVRVDVFATAVIRNATNRDTAVQEIERICGRKINVLSGAEEAHLDYVGARSEYAMQKGTVIDIGGGSTEFVRVKGGSDVARISIPQGSLSSFSEYVSDVLPARSECKAIARSFAKQLVDDRGTFRNGVLYGVGGSVRAAAKMTALRMNRPGRAKTITKAEVDAIIASCVRDRHEFAHDVMTSCAERVHTIVPGCVILSTAFELLEADILYVGKCGIREGYLIERMLEGTA